MVCKAAQQRTEHTAGEGHQTAQTQQVAQQGSHKGYAHAPPGPQQNGAQHVDHMLHRGALAAEHGEAEHAAHHAQGTEHTGEGKLFDREILHDKLAPFQPSAAAQDEHRRSRNKTARARERREQVRKVRSKLTGFLSRRNTASHRCIHPRLRALPLSRLRNLRRGTKKQEEPGAAPPAKNHKGYDFLRRHYPHQVKGSKLAILPLSPLHELPCV